VERQAVPRSPKAVQPKDQPTGNSDRTHDNKRQGNRAVRKKRKEKFGDHIGRSLVVAKYVFSDASVSTIQTFAGPGQSNCSGHLLPTTLLWSSNVATNSHPSRTSQPAIFARVMPAAVGSCFVGCGRTDTI